MDTDRCKPCSSWRCATLPAAGAVRVPGENLIRFTTRRYRQVPLLVRGPGAEVTAAGVLADILRLQAGGA